MPESQKPIEGGTASNGNGEQSLYIPQGFITGLSLMEQAGLDVNAEAITMAQFTEAGLPMVVACTNCEMTMTLPSPNCVIHEATHKAYCKGCVEELPQPSILDQRHTFYFVSEYAVERLFGGPEEGGWWYDWWTFRKVRWASTDREAALDYCQALTEAQKQRDVEERHIDRFSVLGDADTLYVVEAQPGSTASTERPHYE